MIMEAAGKSNERAANAEPFVSIQMVRAWSNRK
jgi:hypothetical protein